ncbi:flagellin [Acidaminobacter sp. JC074]|uniref:flagellin N-terminal helical domain-containing protein n=1 Tax=Acidaminobacter sp. JC074 TaxID=2530199 RepID=UPI0021716B7E|nr:flagellin [Acidaminobacter sp. JC074]MCH4889288.1 flagellin [Acidaminobacter sp. JC074]
MRINNNLMAMNTHRQLGMNSANGAKSIEKLSSGYRINRAGDDAAGLAISEKMRAQIRGLNQSSRNAQDSISLVQTAEGALNESQAILQRMRELAVQSANDTNVDADRSALQNEVDQLSTELTRISNNTEFNERKLLNGGLQTGNLDGELTFHIGANQSQNMSLGIGAMDAKSLGVSRDVTAGTLDATNAAGVSSVAADSVDVDNVLAAGDYQVTVATVASGATASFPSGTTLADAGSLITGTPTADFTSTFTYNHTVANTPATATGITVGDQNDWAFAGGTNGNMSGISIKIHDGNGASDGAAWSGNTLVVNVNNTIAVSGGYVEGLIQAAAAGQPSGIDVTQITITAGSDATAGSAGDTSGAAAAINLTGGVDAAAANFTITGDGAQTVAASGTVVINGTSIDLSQVSNRAAGQNGDSFTITGYASAGTTVQLANSSGTAIGSAVTIDQAAGGEYTIGNSGTGQMDVTFAAGGATVGTTTVTVAQTTSDAATFTGGNTTAATVQGGLSISSQSDADAAITTINSAITKVSDERAKLGAVQNRLEHTIKNLDTSSENLQASESRIRDVDMAKEMMNFTKNNILQQAAQSMLAQANQAPQGVLQLLR